ncbi:hypothetical protein QFC20_000514 [Naganishia adeliensis]|uniref:Uncharacterized protein n=1 Tax=Naganishia adeliensis TaxID=92952 RepID=A0ACC2X1E3_9TREE|nr:hypothetical protein QFC20_000514 [Naganishia adeliensis]
MPQEFVDPETFLDRLKQCFESAATKGSVNLTHKRYTYGPSTNLDQDGDAPMEEEETERKEYDVLIRCTDGMEINFATRIPPSQLPHFHARYGTHLKASMAPTMRKRDKKKEKAKAELVARKRKELYEDVAPQGRRTEKGVGSEEGGKKKLGHRQRQRIQAAQSKKVAERERLEEKEAGMKNSTSSL